MKSIVRKAVLVLMTLIGFASRPIGAEDKIAAQALIQQGDALYPHRMDLMKNEEALTLYKKALAADPENNDAKWRASRAAWWVGSLRTKRDDRIAIFKEGMKWGEDAVQKQPDSADAHFWLGGNYASYGNVKGAFTSLGLIKSIRKEMKEVLRLNDTLIGGGAYRILGILDYKVPGIMGGDKKRALQELEKALAIDTRNPLTLYYLADYYLAVSNKEKARDFFNQFKTLTPSADFAPEYEMMKKQAKEDDIENRLQ